MRFCSLLALVSVAALSACDSGPAISPVPDPALQLAVGTEWTLARTYTVQFDGDGTPSDTLRATGQAASPVTLTVTRDTTVADEAWYRIEPSRRFSHCVFGEAAWYANRADGLYRWTESPADAERVYGVVEGDAFLDTPVVLAVLTDDDATLDLGTGPVPARQYDRTWRRLEFNAEINGPIDPTVTTTDLLSSERGPLALEVSFVRQAEGGTFRPSGVLRYEASAGAPPAGAASGARSASDAFPVR